MAYIKCSECGKNSAYHCEECGFSVCSSHNYSGWNCKSCGGSNTMVTTRDQGYDSI